MSQEWQQDGDTWRFGDVIAERASDDNAFVITSFGSGTSLDGAFSAIHKAMRFGKIRVRVASGTEALIDELSQSGRIRFAPTLGTDVEELGVMGIRS